MATAPNIVPIRPLSDDDWFSPKLADLAANIEIARDRIGARYEGCDMPMQASERFDELNAAWVGLVDADKCLRDADYLP